MMALLRIIVMVFLAARFVSSMMLVRKSGSKSAVTPVEKVTGLLEDLKAEVTRDGEKEAATYGEYSCFCKDTTKAKSDSIKAGEDTINTASADIAADTASKNDKTNELRDRQAKAEQLAADLKAGTEQYAKDKEAYELKNADLEKAISSLDSASKRLEKSKPGEAAFLQLPMTKDLQDTLMLADAMGLIKAPAQQAAAVAFLQQTTSGRASKVDPTSPEFQFHSQGIIDTINELLQEFTDEKKATDAEWEKTTQTWFDTKEALEDEIDANNKAMATLKEEIEALKVKIATTRNNLVQADLMLKDDKLYMTDLTAQCEQRSKDWDQRSTQRADELTALSTAIDILKGNVTAADTSVNERALLQQKARVSPASFLQVNDEVHQAMQRRQQRVVQLLQKEGQRLHSQLLGSIVAQSSADPFMKVKELIQKLVERLLAESTAEATKKGFCDEGLQTAEADRDRRFEDANVLAAEITSLEAKRNTLQADITMLDDNVANLDSTLNESTQIRAQEKMNNLATIKEAKEGLVAVTQALAVLKAFYSQAAKAEEYHAGRLDKVALLQTTKASPVDEDTSGPGFDKGTGVQGVETGGMHAYKGKQEASTSIIGLLEIIKSDFERTIRTTEEMEATQHKEFVEFDRASKTDISGKSTKSTLNAEDLETTINTIAEKMEALQTAMDLLKEALEKLEDLKPMCTDMTMSYEERVQKREEEMEALKKALCILDTEKKEEEDCGPY